MSLHIETVHPITNDVDILAAKGVRFVTDDGRTMFEVHIGVLGWVAASDTQRARELRRAGMTQQQIATSLGVTRYQVRQMLADAIEGCD
jgi:DNA-directed RNA polymerase subunit N (RpoN/RPB10)